MNQKPALRDLNFNTNQQLEILARWHPIYHRTTTTRYAPESSTMASRLTFEDLWARAINGSSMDPNIDGLLTIRCHHWHVIWLIL
jgi:hypothetical protein